jgi:hypothetical protein
MSWKLLCCNWSALVSSQTNCEKPKSITKTDALSRYLVKCYCKKTTTPKFQRVNLLQPYHCLRCDVQRPNMVAYVIIDLSAEVLFRDRSYIFAGMEFNGKMKFGL